MIAQPLVGNSTRRIVQGPELEPAQGMVKVDAI
jgi:hypothetical protein